MPATDYVIDVDTAADLIESNLFRPPYFRITRLQERLVSEKYKNVMWSILARDYNRSLSSRQCAMNVIPHIASGDSGEARFGEVFWKGRECTALDS